MASFSARRMLGGVLVSLTFGLAPLTQAGAVDCNFPCIPGPDAASPAPFTAANPYEEGLTPWSIWRLQRSLGLMGFYDGWPTSTLDDATRSAIRSFEEQAGLPATGEVSPEIDMALSDRADSLMRKLAVDQYVVSELGTTFSYPTAVLTDITADADGAVELHSDDGLGLYVWPFVLGPGQSLSAYREELLNLDFTGYQVFSSDFFYDERGKPVGFYVDAGDTDYRRYDEFFQIGNRLHGFSFNTPSALAEDPIARAARLIVAWSFVPLDPQMSPTGAGIPLP